MSFNWVEIFEKAKAHVGEIREWAGVKYKKRPDGSWRPLAKRMSIPVRILFWGERIIRSLN